MFPIDLVASLYVEKLSIRSGINLVNQSLIIAMVYGLSNWVMVMTANLSSTARDVGQNWLRQ